MRPAVEAGVDQTLAALADPVRRSVVELLGGHPRRAGELAAAFSVTAPAMSRHLRILRRSGLVEESGLEHDARVRVYRLKRERFDQLGGWLAEVGQFWARQLDAFKAHAEQTRGGAGRKRAEARPRRQR